MPVEVATATQGDIELSLKLVGRVEAWSTVTCVHACPGSWSRWRSSPARWCKARVRAGADRSAPAARRSWTRRVATWRATRRSCRRRRPTSSATPTCSRKGFVSKADYDLYKANLAVAKATLQSDRAGAGAGADPARLRADRGAVRRCDRRAAGLPGRADHRRMRPTSLVLNQVEPITGRLQHSRGQPAGRARRRWPPVRWPVRGRGRRRSRPRR